MFLKPCTVPVPLIKTLFVCISQAWMSQLSEQVMFQSPDAAQVQVSDGGASEQVMLR